MKKLVLLSLLAGAAFVVFPSSGQASTAGTEVPLDMNWSFEGPFGTYDRAALQRGAKVYREVCSACHSMKRVAYRNLTEIGYTDEDVKALAAQYTVMDGPNDEGEMFERPARPSDRFKSPFPNDNAAKAANGGALPPDLSLITKARHGGADYVYSILTGYGPAPAGHHLLPGQYWNPFMNGGVIAMPPPLSDGQVEFTDGSPQTVQQYARDVAQFLTWAAEPEMEERKQMGVKVILFLIIFAFLMYGVKRRIWAGAH